MTSLRLKRTQALDIAGTRTRADFLVHALSCTQSKTAKARDGWFYKSHREWQETARIGRKAVSNSTSRLIQAGLLECYQERDFKRIVGGIRTWYRVNVTELMKLVENINQCRQSMSPVQAEKKAKDTDKVAKAAVHPVKMHQQWQPDTDILAAHLKLSDTPTEYAVQRLPGYRDFWIGNKVVRRPIQWHHHFSEWVVAQYHQYELPRQQRSAKFAAARDRLDAEKLARMEKATKRLEIAGAERSGSNFRAITVNLSDGSSELLIADTKEGLELQVRWLLDEKPGVSVVSWE